MPWWAILLTCCGATLMLATCVTGLWQCVVACKGYVTRCEAIYRGDDQLLAMVQRLPVEWAGVQEALKNHLNRISAFDREREKREIREGIDPNDPISILGGTRIEKDGAEPEETLSKIERLGRIEVAAQGGRSALG